MFRVEGLRWLAGSGGMEPYHGLCKLSDVGPCTVTTPFVPTICLRVDSTVNLKPEP